LRADRAKLSEQPGNRFAENITGASGNLRTGQVAKAAPDGYTLLNAFSSLVVNPTLSSQQVTYDVNKDFAPVTLAVASTTTLASILRCRQNHQ
jgi:tripartite-type tricarboxylate transporter receptor subunit TctC